MSQLSLFTRRKAKAPPPPKEDKLHRAVVQLLKVGKTPGWMAWHTPNGGWRDKVTAGQMKGLGTLPGVPDFLLVGPPAARLHALELKRRGGKPTLAQMAFIGGLRAAGGEAECVDSEQQAIEVLARWGAVRVRL